jgi:hypothetical protein
MGRPPAAPILSTCSDKKASHATAKRFEGFAHRVNADGTADSICLFCFATVGSVPTEQALEAEEATHCCWQREESPHRPRPSLFARQR